MKTLVLSILLITTFSANANFFKDWIEKTANKVVGLDPSIVNVRNLEFYYEPNFYGSVTAKGSVFNSSNTKTIKTIVFKYEILECNNSGQNCTTIGESEEKWDTNIPPNQVRYFDHSAGYNDSDSDGVRYRQSIKYVYPYSNM